MELTIVPWIQRKAKMNIRSTLSMLLNNIQQQLFPMLENHVGELSLQYKKLISILEIVKIEDGLPCTRFNLGRPSKSRACIARAYIAKIYLKMIHTKQLVSALNENPRLRIICGWDDISKIPSEATFSRAFDEFAKMQLADKVHQALISQVYEDKIIENLVKDSTPIAVREKPLKKEGSSKERKKMHREKYAKEKKGELSRKQKQLKQDLPTMLAELPTACDIGVKKGSNGYKLIWQGMKVHTAVTDDCLAASVIVTSASVNDSEVAIPLGEKANRIVKNLYDIMDSAYDTKEVREHSNLLGHVALIDQHARSTKEKAEKKAERKRKKILNFYTPQDRRYRKRMPKERFNALFKDYFGGRNIQYRGHSKVTNHIMFGILTLTAIQLIQMVQ